MQVKMLVTVSPYKGQTLVAGTVHEVDDAIAQTWIEKRKAFKFDRNTTGNAEPNSSPAIPIDLTGLENPNGLKESWLLEAASKFEGEITGQFAELVAAVKTKTALMAGVEQLRLAAAAEE